MDRPFQRFLGVALGGGRGKSTALAELQISGEGVSVVEVALRANGRPWTDESLVERLTGDGVVAIDAPLTGPACSRCVEPRCPGAEACVDPAVVWLRSRRERALPWAHRATDLVLTHERALLPIASLGNMHGAIAARAQHLRRRLAAHGFALHENLIEVSPPATIAALVGERAARGYKRDADPWRTRALILESLGDLAFAPRSRMAREEVLANDHGFDAVIAGYTAYRWAREGWTVPDGVFAVDGWIHAPDQTKA